MPQPIKPGPGSVISGVGVCALATAVDEGAGAVERDADAVDEAGMPTGVDTVDSVIGTTGGTGFGSPVGWQAIQSASPRKTNAKER